MMRLFDSLVLILFFFGVTVAGNCLDGVSLTTWPARAQVIFQNASESCSVEVVFNEQARKHGTVKPGTNLVEVNLDFQTYHNLSLKSFRVAFENCDKSFRCYFYHVFSMTELQWRCMQPRYRTVVGNPQYLKILGIYLTITLFFLSNILYTSHPLSLMVYLYLLYVHFKTFLI